MGTSGAYGGSPGWTGTSDDTQDWLDSGGGSGSGSGSGVTGDDSGASDDASGPVDSQDGTTSPVGAPSVPPALAQLLLQIRRGFSRSGSGGSGGGGGGARAPQASGRGGGGRSIARAASIGGRAVGGAYGVRSGVAAPLASLGLSLTDLVGLPKHQQARRILDAALGPSGALDESELRVANAELILWALNQEMEPLPIELANRWVIEYVWQVWITEAGSLLRKHVAIGYDSLRAEQEMRAVLEATISVRGLPADRPLTTGDFEAAIQGALASLGRVVGFES